MDLVERFRKEVAGRLAPQVILFSTGWTTDDLISRLMPQKHHGSFVEERFANSVVTDLTDPPASV